MALRKPPGPEQQLVNQCLDYLRLRGVLCWRQNQGLFPDAHGKRRIRAAGIEGVK